MENSNDIFRDCLGREIKVGDVLAYGHRDGNHGAISVGIVTGFKDGKILATKFSRGYWHNSAYCNKRWWFPSADGATWRATKSHWSHAEQCIVTGMSEADLRAIVGSGESDKHNASVA